MSGPYVPTEQTLPDTQYQTASVIHGRKKEEDLVVTYKQGPAIASDL